MRLVTAFLLTAALVICAATHSGASGASGPGAPASPGVTTGGKPSPAAQQKIQMLGPGQCLNCHDHDKENDWYSHKELLEVVRLFPEKGANAGHVNSLNQLESPKSDAFAKAIGQADKYDANGACVRCHATVFNGDANAGVSCESCHGPASAYLTPHQVKGSYDTAVTQYGMTRLVGNIQGWTQQCTNCHVMDDDRLIKAGHPAGDDFDLSKRYLPVSLHFKKTYSPEQVNAIAKNEMAGIIFRRRPGAPPPPLVAPVGSSPLAGGAPVTLAAPPPPVPEPPPPTAAASQPAAAAPAAPAPAKTPKPAAAKAPPVEIAQPPAGSPTSIEPPPPPPASTTAGSASTPATPPATPPAAAPAPAAGPPADSTSGLLAGPWPWVCLALVLIVVGVVALMKRRKA
jgi:hypothetical protein